MTWRRAALCNLWYNLDIKYWISKPNLTRTLTPTLILTHTLTVILSRSKFRFHFDLITDLSNTEPLCANLLSNKYRFHLLHNHYCLKFLIFVLWLGLCYCLLDDYCPSSIIIILKGSHKFTNSNQNWCWAIIIADVFNAHKWNPFGRESYFL